MIWYFWKGLRPSVKVEMEQRGQELDSFKKLVKKSVNTKAKATIRPHFYACKTDQHCFEEIRPSAAKASLQS